MTSEKKAPAHEGGELAPDQLGEISGGARRPNVEKSLSKRGDNKTVDNDTNLIGDSNVF